MGLFKTTHIHRHQDNAPRHVTKNINIKEHRAPTDESIRLLNEMQEKALKNIVASISLKDNSFNCEAVSLYRKADEGRNYSIYGKFSLNGEVHEFDVEIDAGELMLTEYYQDKVYFIHKLLSKKIAALLMNQLAKTDNEMSLMLNQLK